jgi:hypothetical protein
MLVPMFRRDKEVDLTDVEAALLVRISAETIDRRLAPEHAKMMSRGRAHTKPGTLLKSQIPIRTWADWDDAVPGFVEIDLVGHEGGNSSGQFCYTLTVTDIATGWTVNRSIRNKAAKWVVAALEHVTSVFSFPIIGIDSDYADALHTPRAHADSLHSKGAHYVLTVKRNQRALQERIASQTWASRSVQHLCRQKRHGRTTTWQATVQPAQEWIDLPHAEQTMRLTRDRREHKTGETSREHVFVITSLTEEEVTPEQLAG